MSQSLAEFLGNPLGLAGCRGQFHFRVAFVRTTGVSPLSIAARLEAIADVTNGPNIDRAMRIRLHLAPERRDTPIDAASGNEHGIPPDGVQNRVA